jgi:hypothetical protein
LIFAVAAAFRIVMTGLSTAATAIGFISFSS